MKGYAANFIALASVLAIGILDDFGGNIEFFIVFGGYDPIEWRYFNALCFGYIFIVEVLILEVLVGRLVLRHFE